MLRCQGYGEKTDFTDGRKLNLDASYQVIKEAVEEAGLNCLRSDEVVRTGMIDIPMYEWILKADLVIADLSTYNVNAAYELGVRVGARKDFDPRPVFGPPMRRPGKRAQG
jgi:hypothetical protein